MLWTLEKGADISRNIHMQRTAFQTVKEKKTL
jgi:hypothetical protein